MPWADIVEELNRENIFQMFYEKKSQKTNQREFIIGKVIKVVNSFSSGKIMINCLIAA